MINQTTEWKAGVAAFLKKKPITAVPYVNPTQQAQWRDGWSFASATAYVIDQSGMVKQIMRYFSGR